MAGTEFAAAGNQRVGCGFITWGLAKQPELLDRAQTHAPVAVMLSFGDARPFLPEIKSAGVPAICQVQSLAQARQVLEQGADVIVSQVSEASGHGASGPHCRWSRRSWSWLRVPGVMFRWWRLAALPMGAVLPQR